MKFSLKSLKARLALGLSLLLVLICAALLAAFDHLTRQNMVAAAQLRQDTSLRILTSRFAETYPDLVVEHDAEGRVSRVIWPALPDLSDASLIDRVGAISGETATVFGWDAAEGDFMRLVTNIVKPDGTRAVGTWLGKQNPVHAAMLRKEVYHGEAVILGNPFYTIYQPIEDATGAVIGIFYAGVDKSLVDVRVARQQMTGLVLSLVALALGIPALLLLLSSSLRPLYAISARLETMATGDLQAPVPHLQRGDELGATARAVEVFRQRLTEARAQDAAVATRRAEQDRVVGALREGLARLAQRDLAARIETEGGTPFPEEYEALRHDFNAGIASLEAAMAEVAAVAAGVRGASEEIGTSSDDLAHRVEEQAGTLESSAAALDQLARTGQEIAETAERADGLAQTSRRLSSESELVLRKAIEAIRRIEDASVKINQIISAIDDIAFQTNLLALNAGVEAARAGEAGRGFAVVASEVRSLAQTAAEAAQEIKTLIRDSNDEVREGSSLVQQTGASLGQVLEQVDGLGALISEIALAVRGQTNGLSEINEGVQRLETMTQHNAAVVEELNAAGQSLNTEAHRLSDTLAVFRSDSATSGGWGAPVAPKKPVRAPEKVAVASAPSAAAAEIRRSSGVIEGWDEF
ncbi:methyl-accepting chemotaxis protein [Salipiger marinus]|uniref:methyl-accepting chemotaxis protein n=1 Tax=Salipiger marinus TaxID=555512 RepID=UPI000E804679|nr:methyl-accepting chemotaxis protein [Salipiger manganoxidans]MEB3420353.1 methyl-accepting chemotaxis protein [Salipiger manganoxidans]HBT02784.1 methyl-accepting chemotaxis protein [Citreicella sp.]